MLAKAKTAMQSVSSTIRRLPHIHVGTGAPLSVLVKTAHYGLYHATCEGAFVVRICRSDFEIAGIAANLSPTTSESYKRRIEAAIFRSENARLKRLGAESNAELARCPGGIPRHKNESLEDELSKLRVLPFVGLLLPLDLFAACVLSPRLSFRFRCDFFRKRESPN